MVSPPNLQAAGGIPFSTKRTSLICAPLGDSGEGDLTTPVAASPGADDVVVVDTPASTTVAVMPVRSSLKFGSSKRRVSERRKTGKEYWRLVRNSVWASIYCERLGRSRRTQCGVRGGDVERMFQGGEVMGSLGHFTDMRQLGAGTTVFEVVPSWEVGSGSARGSQMSENEVATRLNAVPPALPTAAEVVAALAPRRPVDRLGNRVAWRRTLAPRNRQLRDMLPTIHTDLTLNDKEEMRLRSQDFARVASKEAAVPSRPQAKKDVTAENGKEDTQQQRDLQVAVRPPRGTGVARASPAAPEGRPPPTPLSLATPGSAPSRSARSVQAQAHSVVRAPSETSTPAMRGLTAPATFGWEEGVKVSSESRTSSVKGRGRSQTFADVGNARTTEGSAGGFNWCGRGHSGPPLACYTRDQGPFPETNYTQSFFAGLEHVKPRGERHPLLVAVDSMQDDEFSHGEVKAEQARLAQRLEELRSGSQRSSLAARRRMLGKDDEIPVPHVLSKVGSDSANGKPRGRMKNNLSRYGEHVEEFLRILDPDRLGKVAPGVFVPLMFWLGLTRRQAAALRTMELAFGPGDIETAKIGKLFTDYVEVQVRLVDGLRELVRRESVEQLCEYMTDSARLRSWFHSMKRDPAGCMDVAEVQNLFARMEVTRDRQALFRFLRQELRSGDLSQIGVDSTSALPRQSTPRASTGDAFSAPGLGNGVGGGGGGGAAFAAASSPARSFGISEFGTLLCRCTFTWCLQRTILLIHPNAQDFAGQGSVSRDCTPVSARYKLQRGAAKTAGGVGSSANAGDAFGGLSLRWTTLQRKIVVSLLVNHRFWGRESRNVLNSLVQTGRVHGDDLSNEQWACLFQRVKAQGMMSILPEGDEVHNPDFLRQKTEHSAIPGLEKV